MNEIAKGGVVRFARVAGAIYLLYFLTAFGGALLTRGIVVSGDPAATARNSIDHEALYRAGFAITLLANVIYVAVTCLF
jgi:hypothetical protein